MTEHDAAFKAALPEPVLLCTVMPEDYRYGHVYGYTKAQMRAIWDARGEADRAAIEALQADARRMREALNVVRATLVDPRLGKVLNDPCADRFSCNA